MLCVEVEFLVGEETEEVRLREGSGCVFELIAFPSKSFTRPITGDSLSKDTSSAPHKQTNNIPTVSITCKVENNCLEELAGYWARSRKKNDL